MVKKSTELVKYHNNMNTVKLRNMHSREWDLFLAVCTELVDKKTDKVTLTFEQLRDKVGYRFDDVHTLAKLITGFVQKVNHSMIQKVEVDDEGYYTYTIFTLFRKEKIDEKNQTVLLRVDEEFTWVLNNLLGEYTAFKLEEFVGVRGKYAKAIYKLCRQWSKSQTYTQIYDVDEFWELLEVPKSYKWQHVDTKIIQPAFTELEPLFGKMILHKHKWKRRIDKVFISFEKQELRERKDMAERLSSIASLIEYHERTIKNLLGRDSMTAWQHIELLNELKSERGRLMKQAQRTLF